MRKSQKIFLPLAGSLKDVKDVLSSSIEEHIFLFITLTLTHSPPHYLVSHQDVPLLDQYCVSLMKKNKRGLERGRTLAIQKCSVMIPNKTVD